MCGIVGSINKELVSEGLEILKHRGTDSFGAIIQIKGKIHTEKSMNLFPESVSSWQWSGNKLIKKNNKKDNLKSKLKKYRDFDFILAHNRWASIGGVNLELAHPIIIGDWAIIHNGTRKSVPKTFKKYESDTQAFVGVWNELYQGGINEFVLSLYKQIIDGAGIVFLVNTKTGGIIFHRDENRPLFINRERNTIASEPTQAGEWFLIKEAELESFNDFTHFLKSVQVYEKSIKVEEKDLFYPVRCKSCKKTHFHSEKSNVCFVCEILGKEAPKTYDYDIYGIYDELEEDLDWARSYTYGGHTYVWHETKKRYIKYS